MYRILMAKNFNQHPPPRTRRFLLFTEKPHTKRHSRVPLIHPVLFSAATHEHFFSLFFFSLTSPHLNLIEFVCAANGSPNDTLIQPVKGDECLHALAAQSMLVIIFLIWWIPPHPALPGNEIISHFDN